MKIPQGRRLSTFATVIAVAFAAGLVTVSWAPAAAAIDAGKAATAADARLQITYPLEGTLFPPESVAAEDEEPHEPTARHAAQQTHEAHAPQGQ